MSINLAIARVTVRGWLRSNGYDATLYTDSQIDQAIADCGEEVARKTILLRKTSQITLTINDNTLPAMPTNFRPCMKQRNSCHGLMVSHCLAQMVGSYSS